MTSQLDEHLAEVTSRTEALVSRSTAPNIKGEQIHRLRITVPRVRGALKRGYSFVTDSAQLNLSAWDYIWQHSAYYEVMSQALYFYQHRALSRAETRTICDWVERCECWEHSDDLSKIYAGVVEFDPKWMLPTFKQWNRSDNPWKRRQSVVGLIEYASRRTRVLPFAELIAFIEPLLDDDEYYVRKGVGWTLREIYNVYPTETLNFIERHVRRIAPQAWTAATEKLAKPDKARLLAARKGPGSATAKRR